MLRILRFLGLEGPAAPTQPEPPAPSEPPALPARELRVDVYLPSFHPLIMLEPLSQMRAKISSGGFTMPDSAHAALLSSPMYSLTCVPAITARHSARELLNHLPLHHH
jgi:hypothetical protein